MKKISTLFTLFILLAVSVTACKLPATDALEPTAASTSALPSPTSGAALSGEPTDTGILPPATPLPAVTDTLPAEAYPAPATAVPAATSTPLPAASRIFFATGANTASVDGELDAGQTLYYVVQGAEGQQMRVDTWSPSGDVTLGVTAATTGGVLLDAALDDLNWTGTLPAAQDYYLSVTATGGRSSYSVTVELTQPAATSAAPTATTAAAQPAGLFNPETAYGEPDYEDPMNGSSVSDWEDEDGELPDTQFIRLSVENQRFYVTGKQPGWSTWYFTWRELSDFYLEATFDSGNCAGQDAYGMIVRGPEHMAGVSFGYVIAFTCDGQLWVFRLDDADPFTSTDLVSLTPTTAINAGANRRNTMGISAEGDTLTIYANGTQVAQVTDASYDAGRIGVFVSPQWTSYYTYRLVNFAYWDLGE